MPVYIDGMRVNYSDDGSGLPIVFVPGLVGSKEWFRYQASGLSDHYRVISCDTRRARSRAEYTLDLLAEDLAEFISALRIHDAVVAGHGFGALVAIRFALNHPDRCQALIAASCAPSFRQIAREDLLSHFAPGEVRFESFLDRILKRFRSRKALRDEEMDPLEYLARHNGGIDPATLSARLAIASETDLSEELSRIVTPTLILVGSRERPEILAGSQLLDERVPDATLEVIEDADHFLFCTRHDFFNSAVAEYLSHRATQF